MLGLSRSLRAMYKGGAVTEPTYDPQGRGRHGTSVRCTRTGPSRNLRAMHKDVATAHAQMRFVENKTGPRLKRLYRIYLDLKYNKLKYCSTNVIRVCKSALGYGYDSVLFFSLQSKCAYSEMCKRHRYTHHQNIRSKIHYDVCKQPWCCLQEPC